LVGIKVRDIHLGVAPTVTVTGKRNKTRSVPLMEKTVEHYPRIFMAKNWP
jgi:site-specific recombinase XerC